MSDVSFFVTHGAAIWQALTATSLALGGLAAWKLVDRGMRARAERVREGLGDPAPAPNANDAGRRVTLAGTLRLENDDAKRDAIAATVVPRGLELSEEPTPKAKGAAAAGKRLVLDVAGVSVVLDGPLEILVGSRETERCIGRARGQTLLWDFAGGIGELPRAFGARVLAAGDRVMARGILRHDPQWGQNYREGSASFALEGDKDKDAETRNVILAYQARPRPLARPKLRSVTRAFIAPLAMFGALSVVGEASVRIPRPFAWTLATATPFRRGDALGLLRGNIGLGTRADPAKIDRAIALDRLRGRCGDAIDDAFEHHQLAHALSLARECNDPWREASIHVASADFPNAADAFERARKRDERLPYSLSEATAYIVTGKHAKAALALRGVGRTWEDGRTTRERLECAAVYEEHRDPSTGEPEPIEALLTQREADGACNLLYWDAAKKTDAERGWFWAPQHVTNARSTMQLMAMEHGQRIDLDVPNCYSVGADLVFDPRRCLYDVPPAVIASAAATASSTPRGELNRALLLLRLARVDSYFGEVDAARKNVADAREALKRARSVWTDAELDRIMSRGEYPYSYYGWEGPPSSDPKGDVWAAMRAKTEAASLDEWDLALDVRSGVLSTRRKDRDWRHDMLTTAGDAKHGDVTALAQLADRDGREANHKPWLLALSNDDEAFVNRLEDRGLDGRGIVDFLGASDRPDLRRWARYDYTTACVTCGLYPLANQIVSRRDAAIAAHADDVAAEMGAAARRLRDILYRRDVAIVLSVISELSPP